MTAIFLRSTLFIKDEDGNSYFIGRENKNLKIKVKKKFNKPPAVLKFRGFFLPWQGSIA